MSSYSNMVSQVNSQFSCDMTSALSRTSGSSSIGNFSALKSPLFTGGCGCSGTYGIKYNSLSEWGQDAAAARRSLTDANVYDVEQMSKAYAKANTYSAKEGIKATWYNGVSCILANAMGGFGNSAGTAANSLGNNLFSNLLGS